MIRTAFEDCKNVTSKRVGGPSPITVYHPPSHEAGCAWGRSIPLRKWYSWDGARAGPGAGVSFEQVAQTPPPPLPATAGLFGPVGAVIGPAQGGGSFTGPAWNLEASWERSPAWILTVTALLPTPVIHS